MLCFKAILQRAAPIILIIKNTKFSLMQIGVACFKEILQRAAPIISIINQGCEGCFQCRSELLCFKAILQRADPTLTLIEGDLRASIWGMHMYRKGVGRYLSTRLHIVFLMKPDERGYAVIGVVIYELQQPRTYSSYLLAVSSTLRV